MLKSISALILSLLLLNQLKEIQCGSAVPTKILNPYYFASYTFQYVDTYGTGTHLLTAPLTRVINNVTSIYISMCSFRSTTSQYFGYDVSISSYTNPATTIGITFEVFTKAGFNIISFSLIIVAPPFTNIIQFLEYYFDTTTTQIDKPINLPTIYSVYFFVVSCSFQSIGTNLYFYTPNWPNGNISYTVQYVAPSTTIYQLKMLFIFIDNDRNDLAEFNYLAWDDSCAVGINSVTNLGVNMTLFGPNLDGYCIFGYNNLNNILAVSPYSYFTLTATGVTNQNQNSPGAQVRSLCFIDGKCPSLYPFQSKYDYLCYDCPDIYLLIPTATTPKNYTKIVGNCNLFDPNTKRVQYDTVSRASINQCFLKCSGCEDHYYASSGVCVLCKNHFPKCILCDQRIQCTLCQVGYFINPSKTCSPCYVQFPNCLTCNQTYQCLSCQPTTFLFNKTCHFCAQFYADCVACNDLECLNCSNNFVNFYGQCVDPSSIKINGCLSPFYINPDFICLVCKINKGFKMDPYGNCLCTFGFVRNPINDVCEEICGDGYAFKDQCDDGNNVDTDGCTNLCKISPGFQCQVTQNSTFCRYKLPLKLSIQQIMKDEDMNSATITLIATNLQFPFDFSTSQFKSTLSLVQIQIPLSTNPPQFLLLPCSIISASGRLINIHFEYNFTIQTLQAKIILNTSKTRYFAINNTVFMQGQLKGLNQPLIVSSSTHHFQNLANGMIVTNLIGIICFICGLISTKYIGLECILTLQLVYYSQLLISNASKWPFGFQYLSYLKYACGFNQIITLTHYIPISSIEKKLFYLTIKRTIIQNFNISFGVLLLCFIIFIVSIITQRKASLQSKYLKKNSNKTVQQRVLLREAYHNSTRKEYFQQVAYRIMTQVSKWCYLQILSAMAAQIYLSKAKISLSSNQMYLIKCFQQIILLVSLGIVLWIGINTIRNIFVDEKVFAKFRKRPEQLLYKNINFVYLNIIGIMIYFFNQQNIGPIPMSLIVLIFHFCYMILINYKVRPYMQSLKIHRRSLLINHIMYLIFLMFINLINFMQQINQLILVFIGYLITAGCAILVVLTIFRLYYEYRYGEALQIQIMKQKYQQMKTQQLQAKAKIKQKIKNYQIDAINRERRKQQRELQRKKNIYMYSNQQEQEKKQALMFWLSKRLHLTKQDKQRYYFQKFAQKPLSWLKKYDKKKYQQVIKKQTQHTQDQKKIKYKDRFITQQQDKYIIDQLKVRMMGNDDKSKKINKKDKYKCKPVQKAKQSLSQVNKIINT